MTVKVKIIETHWGVSTRKVRRIKRRVTREGIGKPTKRSHRTKR